MDTQEPDNKYLLGIVRKKLPKWEISLGAAHNLGRVSTPKHIASLNFSSLSFESKSCLSYSLHSMLIFTFQNLKINLPP